MQRILGFDYQRVAVGEVTLNLAVGGTGAPVVLVHGFPETHLAWRHVAADLARDFTVVCPDLRGYGDSDKPPADGDHDRYSKRTMAADIVGLMHELGHERFALVGHDRGALVAFRAGLDHPEAISHLATLGVIPSVDMWSALGGPAGIFAFHLYFMAHPPDLPERMIGADPDLFFGHFLDTWVQHTAAIPAKVRAAYLAATRPPDAIGAVCADYRAEAFVDVDNDQKDRADGHRLQMPVLALWEDPGDTPLPFDPAAVWQAWADNLRTRALPGGHFLPEESPTHVTTAIRDLLAA
jgi:pimeloyl-ACP methyl ester carboxylesterase